MTTRRRWSALDDITVRTGYQDGTRPAVLAEQLDRTVMAVVRQQHRLGLRLRHRHLIGAAAVANVMGISDRKTVTTWVVRGWLRPYGQRARPWCFDSLAVWDLCANPQTMMAWDAQHITEPELRVYATEQRALHPRWLRTREVAARYHVEPITVTGWVAQDRFAPDDVARYNGLWIRETALDGFVPPCEQRWVRTACGRRRVPVGRSTPPDAVLICAACWPSVRVLPGGHLLRLMPPMEDATVADGARSTNDAPARSAA